ncbi:MAG: S16 family serine protease [Thermodesulfobacteriota bacterium]
MIPIEFDHTVLESLPLPSESEAKRVVDILKIILSRRVFPYFRHHRGTDPIVIRQVSDGLKITRMEDSDNRVRAVCLMARKDTSWEILIHERVFDFLAFVVPGQTEARIGDGTPGERKMLAFAEFMLRHQVEHMLYPGATERDVMQSDVDFTIQKRTDDPTFYRALRLSLSDELNGLKGQPYLALFDCMESGKSCDALIRRILNAFVIALADMPERLLREVFSSFCTETKTKVLGVCYRRSQDMYYPLLRRTAYLEELLRLFILQFELDEKEARTVFDSFIENWGVVYILQELGLPEAILDDKSPDEIFDNFKRRLTELAEELVGIAPALREPPSEPIIVPVTKAPTKSLKDRIEEIRSDPAFPRQVMEVIDKNKLNIAGVSGYKYSELIETLLAINWGRIQKITVRPEEFEEGLNKSHYGLEKPKQIICDFFTNLIWRYQQFDEKDAASWKRNGSAFLFVGPAGVGKTSLAISIANNLGIPFHKLSLGGMKDEADLRGHGFTYEGSKPGAIVQGIIKMGVMNGMFIMDEADKTDKVAIATLLEILDPEQNHLFHDKYTQTTIDIDLSNFHFILTANTLETVPPPVVNRCEVVMLDHYSIEEKIAIAQEYLIDRVRKRYLIGADQIFIDPEDEVPLLRHLISTYTHEAGVRELERIIRQLFLRVFRKEILTGAETSVRITRGSLKRYLEAPTKPRMINNDDRMGEMMALGVNVERGIGSVIPVQATPIETGEDRGDRHGYVSMVHATGNIERVMDESRRVATTAILHWADQLGIDLERARQPIHLHFMGGSTPKDGPSAGGAIALALASVLSGRAIRRDVAMSGEIDTHGRITAIGALVAKLETARDAGCRTVIVPKENAEGQEGIDRLPDALKRELQILTFEEWEEPHQPFDYGRQVLQIVLVDHILQAAKVTFIYEEELKRIEDVFTSHALSLVEKEAWTREARDRNICLIYAKGCGELTLEGLKDTFWDDHESNFLILHEAGKEIREAFPHLETGGRFHNFDPSTANIPSLMETITQAWKQVHPSTTSLSLVAPFFAIKRDRDLLDEFSRASRAEQLMLFANNYTGQGFKVKSLKPILNRAYWWLSQLDHEALAACPFLAQKDGVYVVDCSLIPEKYRLDVARAADLINWGLMKWLHIVETQAKERPDR